MEEYVTPSALLARLTSFGFFEHADLGILTMRKCLEEDKDTEVYGCVDSAAAKWMLYAGQIMFVYTVQAPRARRAHESEKILGPGPLFAGPDFGLERWKFWQNKTLLMGSIERNMLWCSWDIEPSNFLSDTR